MTKVDQFQSVFRAAEKPVFHYKERSFQHILLATDLDPEGCNKFEEQIRNFLGSVGDVATLTTLGAQDFQNAPELLVLLENLKPDLIVTYRNLHSEAWRWPFSLGECLDLVTQTTQNPVLVVPHPKAGRAAEHALMNTNVVMAISGHLAGDDELVNTAAAFTRHDGQLWLTHVEDDAEFQRISNVIGKIPTIDTEAAQVAIMEQLLKEPHDYIRSCTEDLKESLPTIRISELVTSGHRLSEYRRLIEEHRVDLLVLHSKDEDQMAMHGLAYPLAIELREVPMLML
jgi:hypothetical protein